MHRKWHDALIVAAVLIYLTNFKLILKMAKASFFLHSG